MTLVSICPDCKRGIRTTPTIECKEARHRTRYEAFRVHRTQKRTLSDEDIEHNREAARIRRKEWFGGRNPAKTRVLDSRPRIET